MARTKVKTDAEIAAMRASGKILASILEAMCGMVAVGVTSNDLDKRARKLLADAKAEPAFLGYQGFPKSVCVSVNDAVVHGIPNDTPFRDGDIVSVDFGVRYQGMITDAARSVIVGKASPRVSTLVSVTESSLLAGINQLRDGVQVGTIAAAIEAELKAAKLGIVRDLVGHGVGHHLHEEPNIPNYGTANTGPALKAGMTIAIEPMATLGGHQVYIEDDGWTIKTADQSLAAHFEDTILITRDGYEILTAF